MVKSPSRPIFRILDVQIVTQFIWQCVINMCETNYALLLKIVSTVIFYSMD
eukprot:Pgem_evm1s1099